VVVLVIDSLARGQASQEVDSLSEELDTIAVSDKELFVPVEGDDFALVVHLLRLLVVNEQLGRPRTIQPSLDQRRVLFILNSVFLH